MSSNLAHEFLVVIGGLYVHVIKTLIYSLGPEYMAPLKGRASRSAQPLRTLYETACLGS